MTDRALIFVTSISCIGCFHKINFIKIHIAGLPIDEFNGECTLLRYGSLFLRAKHLRLIAAFFLLLAVCSGILNYVISPREIHCKYMVYVLHLRSAISMIVYRL